MVSEAEPFARISLTHCQPNEQIRQQQIRQQLSVARSSLTHDTQSQGRRTVKEIGFTNVASTPTHAHTTASVHNSKKKNETRNSE